MKVERGEIRDSGQFVEIERLIKILVDVFENPMHSALVYGATVAGRHEAPNAHTRRRRLSVVAAALGAAPGRPSTQCESATFE